MEIFAVIRKSFEGRAPARPHFAATDQEVGEKEVGQSYDQDVVKKHTDHELSVMIGAISLTIATATRSAV